MKIKAKIIGNQIWTTENLSRTEYQQITGRNLPVKNDCWADYHGPICFTYDSAIKNKKEYLFDLNAVVYLRANAGLWRIPDTKDLDLLFKTIDPNSRYFWGSEKVAQELRGTYGWVNNGINKVGFNAYPNPTLDLNGLLEFEISRWWYFNDQNASFCGFSVYREDIVAISGPFTEDIGLAIRLVRDLVDPRPEGNIDYV